MVDEHRLAIEEVVAGENYLAGGRCLDRCAGLGGEIQPRMRIAFFTVEEAAQAERRGERTIDGFVEQQVAGLVGAEAPVGFGLFGQFPLDALEVVGVRVDLAFVLQGDVLGAVFARLDLEAALAAIDLDLLCAGLGRERDTEDGDPALAVLVDHQCRLALVAHLRRDGTVAQIDHGDATRHRLVQQAGDEAFGVNGEGKGSG